MHRTRSERNSPSEGAERRRREDSRRLAHIASDTAASNGSGSNLSRPSPRLPSLRRPAASVTAVQDRRIRIPPRPAGVAGLRAVAPPPPPSPVPPPAEHSHRPDHPLPAPTAAALHATGQISSPPLGSSVVRHRADLVTATGQFLMSLDTGLVAICSNRGRSGCCRRHRGGLVGGRTRPRAGGFATAMSRPVTGRAV